MAKAGIWLTVFGILMLSLVWSIMYSASGSAEETGPFRAIAIMLILTVPGWLLAAPWALDDLK